MLETVQAYCQQASLAFASISSKRQETLTVLARLVQEQLATLHRCQLTFICTHNSRRSHFGQIWAQVATHYYGLGGITTFSGGTEATAFHPNAIAALQRAGLLVSSEVVGTNPTYQVTYSEDEPALSCFSKVYEHTDNPSEGFIALMTCGEADQGCPFVSGATHRLLLTYKDPKIADGTPKASETYDARCHQVATEMLFLFNQIAKD